MQKKLFLSLLASSLFFISVSSKNSTDNEIKDSKYTDKLVTNIGENNLVSALVTKLRSKNTKTKNFKLNTDMLANIIAIECSRFMRTRKVVIETPLGNSNGIELDQKLAFVPILRSGLTLSSKFYEIYPSATVGHVGLKRNEETAKASCYLVNLPENIADDRLVIIPEPMLATGGSACDTIKILKEHGVQEENILFATVISAIPGLQRVRKEYPKVRILTCAIDEKLTEEFFIYPGLGDFGDRFFGSFAK